jgi:hypothetical protein
MVRPVFGVAAIQSDHDRAKVVGITGVVSAWRVTAMSGVIQTGYGVNKASLRDLPDRNNGILVALVATAGMDLIEGISVGDNQGNTLRRIRLFEMWSTAAGDQSMAICLYGLVRLPDTPKGTYTVDTRGLPAGRNGGVAGVALLEVNGVESLDRIGSNGSPTAMGEVTTRTTCSAVNTSSHDLVISAFGVRDTSWTYPPRDLPSSGYTSVASDVIISSGGNMFAAIQVAYKVVQAIETSAADWGTIAIAGGGDWPWVSAVASFVLSDAAGRANREGLPRTGPAAVAPLAWIIERRRRRAVERASGGFRPVGG